MKVRRILLVDDDADDLELFLEALQELDASISCDNAANGVDAIQKLSSIELPDIIFLDINMPKMDGWQCLSIIKNDPSLQHIPVVMYSTATHQHEVKKALSLGAKEFFSKPDSFKELKDTLKKEIGIQ